MFTHQHDEKHSLLNKINMYIDNDKKDTVFPSGLVSIIIITVWIFISGTDFCALGNDCHINASCVNLATRYACQCHSGFQGDGRHCKGMSYYRSTVLNPYQVRV